MRQLACVLTVVFGLTGGAAAEELPVSAPEAHGFDSAGLAGVVEAARASGQPIHSVMMLRGGDVILDASFYPYDGRSLHDVASVTKSVTTSLVGIAAGEGLIDLEAPMLSFFPGRAVANRDARKEAITVGQLTRNLSGLDCTGSPAEVTLAQMQASPDFVQFTLDLKMRAEPGTRFDYCSPGLHLLSAILQQATGRTMFDYAKEKLFAPLGITEVAWDADPQGVTRGWGDLHLLPADMARLGLMWLHDGAWEGQQVVPRDWLVDAGTRAGRSDRYEDYGAGFWVGPKAEPIPYFHASGRAGQRILMAKPLDLVIVTTGGGFDPGDIVDPLVGTLADPGAALPANPEGKAALATAIGAAAAAPEPQPVPPLPPIAAQVDGRVYHFEENPTGLRSARFDLGEGAEASFILVDAAGSHKRPFGRDGVYRFSPADNDIPLGIRGGWTDEGTLVLDYNSIGDLRAYTITAKFQGDKLSLTIRQRDEVMTVTLTGEARAAAEGTAPTMQ